MILEILKHPNPKLKEKSLEITPEMISDPEFKEFVQNMKQTMIKKDGIGLAAPQVDRLIRVIVINIDSMSQAFINPKITKKSLRKNIMEEGCLSIPGVYKNVKRSNSVSVEYLDMDGKKHKIKTSGLPARVFQHEIDHLDGVLFIDRAKK